MKPADRNDITVLRHVRSRAEILRQRKSPTVHRARISASSNRCSSRWERDLKSGVRKTRRFGRDASITIGNFFILGGQLAYVAEMGEQYRTPNSETNARLRVIYVNGTESDLLLRFPAARFTRTRSGFA